MHSPPERAHNMQPVHASAGARREPQHPSPHQTEYERAPAITAKGPATVPLSRFGWALWRSFSFVSLSPPAPSTPLERTRRGPRTIAPFADGLHAQLTFVAGRARRELRVHPGRPNHITRRRRIENVRAAIRATWCRQPLSPVSDCMRRAYVRPAIACHPRAHSPLLPATVCAARARPREHSTQVRRTHSGTVRSARTRAD